MASVEALLGIESTPGISGLNFTAHVRCAYCTTFWNPADMIPWDGALFCEECIYEVQDWYFTASRDACPECDLGTCHGHCTLPCEHGSYPEPDFD